MARKKKRQVHHCKKCGRPGHNKRTCFPKRLERTVVKRKKR